MDINVFAAEEDTKEAGSSGKVCNFINNSCPFRSTKTALLSPEANSPSRNYRR
jgi:hypothetical protein